MSAACAWLKDGLCPIQHYADRPRHTHGLLRPPGRKDRQNKAAIKAKRKIKREGGRCIMPKAIVIVVVAVVAVVAVVVIAAAAIRKRKRNR